MDPVGRQEKIPSNDLAVKRQKLIDGGGAKNDYGQDLTTGTWQFKMNPSTKAYRDWSGKVEGKRKGDSHAD